MSLKNGKVSISEVKAFLACPRQWYLRWIEDLIPTEEIEALRVGTNYHERIEWLNENDSFDGLEEDYSKEQAMAAAYSLYVYPKLKVAKSEEWFSKKSEGAGVTLIGRVDGLTEDGMLVEHKTTSSEIGADYEYKLAWDMQIPMYMLLTGARRMYYTVCRKPTIRQKKGESDQEFYDRMVGWYAEDTESKIAVLEITRTDAEIAEFEKGLDYIICQMKRELADFSAVRDEDYLIPKNPSNCRIWGRFCEYHSVCLHYNPEQEYVEFTRKE